MSDYEITRILAFWKGSGSGQSGSSDVAKLT